MARRISSFFSASLEPPEDPFHGEHWLDVATGIIYLWGGDVVGYWVEAGASDTFPPSAEIDQMHTVGERTWRWNGIAWQLTHPTTLAGYGITDPIMLTTGNQTTTGGFAITSHNAGTISSGSFQPVSMNGNYQYYINGGAHTLTAPSVDCALDLLVTNNASAGEITFSGFTFAPGNTGDYLTTTDTHKFLISIVRINGIATYLVKALQAES